MEIIKIDESNIDSEHICCAIGSDKANKARAQTKKDWLKDRFPEGLVFKRLNDRGKMFIEYMPLENAWKPIIGKNYMLINCLWVSGKFKKQGIARQLLADCIMDAKDNKMTGIAVVTSKKKRPFLTDKRFFEKYGFETVDLAPPYFELAVLKFDPKAKNPAFTETARAGTCAYKKGVVFVYSTQCPFMKAYVTSSAAILKKRGLAHKIYRISSADEARKIGSPFGTLGIYYNGEIQTHELMPEKKFVEFIKGLEPRK
jgi:GNAT superfamily N-acetyltransferase